MSDLEHRIIRRNIDHLSGMIELQIALGARWFVNEHGRFEMKNWPAQLHLDHGFWIHHTQALSETQCRNILREVDNAKQCIRRSNLFPQIVKNWSNQ